MTEEGAQDSSVEEISQSVLRITPPEDEAPRLSFSEHHDMLDRFIEDCRNWLRSATAYRGCEAQVVATWRGHAIMLRHEMTNASLPDGGNLVITVKCNLPIPWLCEPPMDYVDVMRQGLAVCDQAIEKEKVKYKCLRISFSAYAKAMSLTLAKPTSKDNGRQTAIAVP